MIELLNVDCIEYMKTIPDKYFDLGIVDPIYGDVTKGGYANNANIKSGSAKHRKYNIKAWNQQKTNKSYFDELFRISKNQIIWGGGIIFKQ